MTSSRGRRTTARVAGVALGTLLGMVLVVMPWLGSGRFSTTASIGFVLVGLGTLTGPLATWLRHLAPARPTARITVAPGEAIEVRLRPHLLVGTLAVSTVWSAFFAWAMVAAGLDGPGWLLAPLLLLFLALAPDPLRALWRGPRLRIDADGVTYRGWQVDARLAWEDIVDVDVTAPQVRRPVLRLQGRVGTASCPEHHRIVFPLESRPDAAVIDVPLLALDAPGPLLAFLDQMRHESRVTRVGRLDLRGVSFLDQTMARPV